MPHYQHMKSLYDVPLLVAQARYINITIGEHLGKKSPKGVSKESHGEGLFSIIIYDPCLQPMPHDSSLVAQARYIHL